MHGHKQEQHIFYNDQILRLELKHDSVIDTDYFDATTLYTGNIGFDYDHRIECIPFMESVDIQKVYWIDGINYPRVINIVKEGGYLNFDSTEDPFSFYQLISSGSYNTIDVSKSYVGGLFYAGVIQYAFSFYNKNAQETPVIYTTPLNYISHSDRGEVANKQLGCAFDVIVKINIEDHDNFEYVRVYSIYRSSINETPIVKIIKDVKCDDFIDNTDYFSMSFTDTNEQGYDFDAYRILVNSEHIVPNAIGYKDQKMFLGNIKTDDTILSDDRFLRSSVNWVADGNKTIDFSDNEGKYYEYRNQNQDDSNKIKTFKYGEYYKLGLQFQDEFGRWSSPYIVGTYLNKSHPVYNDDTEVYLPYAKMQMTIKDVCDLMQDEEFGKKQYAKVRPVVSFPTISERKILCQGIMNPTVFNITDRYEGTCFSQASWFFRPYPYRHLVNGQESTRFSFQGNVTYKVNDIISDYDVTQYRGAVCQFKHYEPLFPSDDIGGEIQGMYFDVDFSSEVDALRPYKNITEFNRNGDDLSVYRNYYYIDQSIGTLNSPDIDFDDNVKNVDFNQYSLRIIGIIPFSSNNGNYNIIAETPLFLNNKESQNEYIRGTTLASGFQDFQWKQRGGWNQTHYYCAGSQQVSALNCWFDDLNGFYKFLGNSSYNWNEDSRELSYYVYPWNREYLNNYNCGLSDADLASLYTDPEKEDINTSKVLRKTLSNVKFAKRTFLFDYDEENDFYYDTEAENVKLFSQTESDSILKISDDMFYKGNCDSLLTYNNRFILPYKISSTGGPYPTWNDSSYYEANGYPIMTGDTFGLDLENDYNHSKNAIMMFSHPKLILEGDSQLPTANVFCNDPILMRYKSGSHVVFRMPLTEGQTIDTQKIMPIKELSSMYKITGYDDIDLIWNHEEDHHVDIEQDEIPVSQWVSDSTYLNNNDSSDDLGYLWLGELYKKEDGPYSQDSDDDKYSRVWVPCGDEYLLDESDQTNHVAWTEGDTFFQRYDCLKTYPYSAEDYQSVVDIASMMVETHVNLDGRYDENRGLIDNTFVNPTNFNLINPVYSQTNNFFQYNVLDEEDFKTTDFPTRFTWSLNKINGQDIDEWTRTNTAAFYDCDGDKGPITSLRRFNGQIYAFQDKGISRIKYNENVAINTNNGTPIELANSQSVNGVEYLSELVGSQNKWSNISTPNGIFFTDNYTAGLYRLGGGERVLTNLTKNVLQRWFESNNTNHDFINTTSFDANMNEIHFMFDNQSLAYNNDFGVFSSFYDYKGWIGNIKNHSFNITDNKLYFLREGQAYNRFYDNPKTNPYWISFVANSNIDGYSPSNAIYDNVWYNADSLNEDNTQNLNYNELIEQMNEKIPNYEDNDGSTWYETFNKIECGNDYQYGMYESDSGTQTKNFKFIKKFRTWRVPVPRNQIGTKSGNLHRDRMRNQWLRVKLTNTNPSTNKMVLRDIYVDSFF